MFVSFSGLRLWRLRSVWPRCPRGAVKWVLAEARPSPTSPHPTVRSMADQRDHLPPTMAVSVPLELPPTSHRVHPICLNKCKNGLPNDCCCFWYAVTLAYSLKLSPPPVLSLACIPEHFSSSTQKRERKKSPTTTTHHLSSTWQRTVLLFLVMNSFLLRQLAWSEVKWLHYGSGWGNSWIYSSFFIIESNRLQGFYTKLILFLIWVSLYRQE